jgi:hypothetical protein
VRGAFLPNVGGAHLVNIPAALWVKIDTPEISSSHTVRHDPVTVCGMIFQIKGL